MAQKPYHYTCDVISMGQPVYSLCPVLSTPDSFAQMVRRQDIDDVMLKFHEKTKEILFRTKRVRLTRTEYGILSALYADRGNVCSRETLLINVWGRDVFVERRTIDRHVVKLRRKLVCLCDSAFDIETVWGIGYRLRVIGHGFE